MVVNYNPTAFQKNEGTDEGNNRSELNLKQWVFLSSGEGNCEFFKETQKGTRQKERKPNGKINT